MSGTGVDIYTVRMAHREGSGVLVGDYPPEVISYLGFDKDGIVPSFNKHKQWLLDNLSENMSNMTKRPAPYNGQKFSGISFTLRYLRQSA